MIIRSGDLRIHTGNLITHNVGEVETDYTINGKKKKRFAIFCNFAGGGYREIVAFKTKNAADDCCDMLDYALTSGDIDVEMIDIDGIIEELRLTEEVV